MNKYAVLCPNHLSVWWAYAESMGKHLIERKMCVRVMVVELNYLNCLVFSLSLSLFFGWKQSISWLWNSWEKVEINKNRRNGKTFLFMQIFQLFSRFSWNRFDFKIFRWKPQGISYVRKMRRKNMKLIFFEW